MQISNEENHWKSRPTIFSFIQAAGLPAAWTEKPLPIPNTKPFENTLKILDMIPCQERHFNTCFVYAQSDH